LFSAWYRWKLTHLALNNNHSLPSIAKLLKINMIWKE
jgi:hypothetical protein